MEVIQMAERGSHAEQIGFGVGLTTDLAIFEQKDVLYPTDLDEKKHQTPPQIRKGNWESSYES